MSLLWACTVLLFLALACFLLFEELTDGWSSFLSSAFALFAQGLRGDDPLLAVEVPLDPTLQTADFGSFLPYRVRGMACVWCLEGLVHTWAFDESAEGRLIGSFVDVEATLEAFKIASCLCKLMFLWSWRVGLLLGQDVPDVLGPGDFLGQWFSLAGGCRTEVLNLYL